MSKDWRTRLSDTYTFIRNANVPSNGNLRALIADELEHRFGPSIGQATSDGLSQGHMMKLGPVAVMPTPGGLTAMNTGAAQDHRSYRRAITLIRSVILGQPVGTAASAVSGIADHGLPGQLGNALNQAHQHLRQQLTNALGALRADPASWLANHKIFVQTATTSGPMQYVFFHNHPKKRYDFMPPSKIGPNGPAVGTLTGQDARVTSLDIAVHHVHVQNYTTIQPANIAGTRTGAGDDLMVTTQLSGCSLVHQIQGGTLVAAHIEPGGADGSEGRRYSLATTLRARGGFANGLPGVPVATFGAQEASGGPLDYVPNTHTHIIGVKRGGAWELHAQQGDSSNPNSSITTWPAH